MLESEVAQHATEHQAWHAQQQQWQQHQQQLEGDVADARKQLAAAVTNAKQQQKQEQAYQDELVADKQQAVQVSYAMHNDQASSMCHYLPLACKKDSCHILSNLVK